MCNYINWKNDFPKKLMSVMGCQGFPSQINSQPTENTEMCVRNLQILVTWISDCNVNNVKCCKL